MFDKMACVAGALILMTGGVNAAEQTVEGVLVDPSTYLQEGRHDVDSTELALDGGQSLAVLDTKTENLYLLLAEEAGEDPNELVYEYLDQGPVQITGEVYERGGVHGIVPKTVTSTTPAPASSEATNEDAP